MSADRTTTHSQVQQESVQPCFTLASANAALVYVRRIVADIVRTHAALMTLRDRRSALADASPAPAVLDEMRAQAEQMVERLNALQEELGEVGCILKDWKSGLVDFPALHEDRKIWLCWKDGEPQIAHWHELNEGFGGRKPIDATFAES